MFPSYVSKFLIVRISIRHIKLNVNINRCSRSLVMRSHTLSDKLLISEEKLDPVKVPTDGSSIKFKLVEILENKPDPIFALHDIWVLEALEKNPLQTQGNNATLITPSIEINITEMKKI